MINPYMTIKTWLSSSIRFLRKVSGTIKRWRSWTTARLSTSATRLRNWCSLTYRRNKLKMNLSLNSLYRKLKSEPEKSLIEQLKEQIDLAQEFDTLQALPGWEKVAKFMAQEVHATLLEATRMEFDPAKQAIFVNKWNAKRELLDKAISFMESAQRERDRIIEEYKEARDAGEPITGN